MPRCMINTMTQYQLTLDEAELARYALMARRALAQERAAWERAGIVPGARIADVGCGPGAVSAVLADLVGPAGSVIGVERDPVALEHARGVTAGRVELVQGDADRTGLEPGSVDVVMMRHVLAHNGGREQAIVDHLATLVRPGGCVYLVDVVLDSMRTHPAVPDLQDLGSRYAAFHAHLGNDPSVGLRLGDLLTRAGLVVEHHEGAACITPMPAGLRPPSWNARAAMQDAGLCDASDIDRWQAALERVDQLVEPASLWLPLFTASGRRPGSAA